jgi:hypothetical protein
LGPAVKELFQGELRLNLATQPFVFTPKRDGSFPDPGYTTLRNGWTPYVATGVLQKMPFILERLNLDYPISGTTIRTSVYKSTHSETDPTEKTRREAIIRKVQTPQAHTILSNSRGGFLL